MKKRSKDRYPSVSTITQTEHIKIVKEIFSTITKRYDFLNHFLSMRRDIAWRRFAVKKMCFSQTHRLLDVACGTADIALMAAAKYPEIHVTGLDFVQTMLETGQRKIGGKGLSARVKLVRGDAVSLPFDDGTFDVTSIAFGIRNIPDRTSALKEMLRVTVPGGQIIVLEMTFSRNSIFRKLYHTYLNRILPNLAKRFSANAGAYFYLADSIMNFPAPDEFAQIMEEIGFEQVKKYRLTMGITYLHTGIKPEK
jgi:demethylmenaquinone methyltransferase/2-methoxy-6-polyprenyl-1,4-benzoquinol methylase